MDCLNGFMTAWNLAWVWIRILQGVREHVWFSSSIDNGIALHKGVVPTTAWTDVILPVGSASLTISTPSAPTTT